MGLKSRLLSGTFYMLLSTLGVNAIALVTTLIYTRLLTPPQFGVLGIFLTLAATIGPFASLKMEVGAAKFSAEFGSRDPKLTEASLGAALTVTLLSGGALSVAYFLLADSIASFYGEPVLSPMIRISSLVLLLSAVTALTQGIIQGFQAIPRLAVLNVSAQALGIPLVFAFVSAYGLIGAAASGAVFTAVVLGLSLYTVRGILRPKGIRMHPIRDRPSVRRLLHFSAPLLLSTILIRPALLFVATAVALWLTYREYAVYRVATSLYRVVLILPAVIGVPLLPAISEAYATETMGRTRTQVTLLLRLSALIAVPVALLMGLGARLWLGILFPGYPDAAILLFVLSFAALLDTLGAICDNTFIGSGRTWFVLRLNAAQVVALVGGTILFVPAYGVIGAAYATVLSSLTYFAGAVAGLERSHDIDLRQLLDVGGVTAAAAALSVVLVATVGLDSYILAGVLLTATVALLLARTTEHDRALLRYAFRSVFGLRSAR